MQITIYSTAACAACHTLMKWLDGQNIEYVKKIIDEDADAMVEYVQASNGMIGVPLTVIKNNDEVHTLTGFNPQKFKEVLQKG